MLQKQIKLTLLILASWLMSSKTFSQTVTVNSNKDTTICFTIPQAKFLAKQHYKVLELKALDSICEKQLVKKDSIIFQKTVIALDWKKAYTNQTEVVSLKDTEILGLKSKLATANKEIRRQKLFKWVAIITGGACTGFVGYKWATKP
jgi:hypothetical protein